MGISYLSREYLLEYLTQQLLPPDPEEGWLSVGEIVEAMQAAGVPGTRDQIRQRVYGMINEPGWENTNWNGERYARKVKEA